MEIASMGKHDEPWGCVKRGGDGKFNFFLTCHNKNLKLLFACQGAAPLVPVGVPLE